MGEGLRGREPLESRPSAPTAGFERAERVGPIERLMAERWEALNASLEVFEEKEAEEALDPERFMIEVIEAWENRHEKSGQVDTMSPFDRINFLLGMLVEEGAEWSAQKRAAVRRALYGFAQQSVGAMTLQQQEILNRTILSDPNIADVVGSPREGEQKLIKAWMKDTVGRGVR